ncbi:MAG TPA: anthranilate phosphoribosyltransferase, partial [Saliniramus sp.]|nr:anthranilate phosphoribosyltransferase [Saliniramus sp.]
QDLKGSDPEHNAAALRAVLDGAKNAYRDISVLNAAASLVVAEKAKDLREGVDMAAQAIDSGAARGALDKLVAVSKA